MPQWQQLNGPILRATVGDSGIVHFKNGLDSDSPLSVHSHNFFYNEGTQNHTAHFHGEILREISRRNLYKDVFGHPSALAVDLIMAMYEIIAAGTPASLGRHD